MEDVRRWLLCAMDEAFDERAWHGPNLLGSVRGLSASQAAWRPAPDRHSVWELVLHCAYWKHRVHGRVAAGSPERFPRPGRNFPRLPETRTDADWRADVELLKAVHGRLREAAVSLPAAELQLPGPGPEAQPPPEPVRSRPARRLPRRPDPAVAAPGGGRRLVLTGRPRTSLSRGRTPYRAR